MSSRILLAMALCVLCAMPLSAARKTPMHNPWMRVPGGELIHESCIYSVENMHLVDKVEPCAYRASITAPGDQIYAMDVHYTPATELMYNMNASFKAPELPTQDDQQVVYFWPGFKSTQPTMGLPVLQPVLQYGADCCGGGDYWCVRSWFVWGDQGVAYQSPEVRVNPGDLITSYMSYDNASQIWTINAYNTVSMQNSTLFISRTGVSNTDFHVAMLVLEIIMDLSLCADLPASNSITFTNALVNGHKVQWEDRVQSSACGERIDDEITTVTFNWNSQAKANEPVTTVA